MAEQRLIKSSGSEIGFTQDIKSLLSKMVIGLCTNLGLGKDFLNFQPLLSLAWPIASGVMVSHVSRLFEEINKLKRAKKLKKKLQTDKPKISLVELLRIIERGDLEEERFLAMKSILLSSFSKDSDKKDEELAYELFQIAKQLSGSEILILKAAYDISENRVAPSLISQVEKGTNAAHLWCVFVAAQIGHNMQELVEKQEGHLAELKLIGPRHQPHNFSTPTDDFKKTPHFRLTPLGYKFCEFITKF